MTNHELAATLTVMALCAIGIVLLLSWPNAASAQYQNRIFYDANGRVASRSTTSSSGQTTFYGSGGNVIGRTQPLTGGTTVIYDAAGRRAGTIVRSGR